MKQDSGPGWKYAGLPPKQYRAPETALVRHLTPPLPVTCSKNIRSCGRQSKPLRNHPCCCRTRGLPVRFCSCPISITSAVMSIRHHQKRTSFERALRPCPGRFRHRATHRWLRLRSAVRTLAGTVVCFSRPPYTRNNRGFCLSPVGLSCLSEQITVGCFCCLPRCCCSSSTTAASILPSLRASTAMRLSS